MAVVIVREYSDVASTFGGGAPAPAEPAQTDQVITTSASSAATAAFGANTRLVGVSTPAAGAVAMQVGASPGVTTAAVANASARLPANAVLYFGVRPGFIMSFVDVT